LRAIDVLFGWTPAAREPLPVVDLVNRMTNLLRASIRYALQLPISHYLDVVPGQEGAEGPIVFPDGSILRLSDGSPYVPHHTYVGLIRHIVGHAVKFMYLTQHPASEVFRDFHSFAPIGEPLDGTPMSDLVAKLDAQSGEIHRWSVHAQEEDLNQLVNTDQGARTLHQMLDLMVYATAQHTRQMLSILEILGIVPNEPLADGDFADLALPTRVWS
jgi:hypothetical protein